MASQAVRGQRFLLQMLDVSVCIPWRITVSPSVTVLQSQLENVSNILLKITCALVKNIFLALCPSGTFSPFHFVLFFFPRLVYLPIFSKKKKS